MRRTGLILLLMILSSAFCAEAKSTMELLINKEWYEIDLGKMQVRDDYYVKFTGTQRLTIGLDQEGNTKMRVQKYYLSDYKDETFDSTKIGKIKTGKYIILQSLKNKPIYCKVVDIETDFLQLENISQNKQIVCYISDSSNDSDNEHKIKGDIISTQSLLSGITWFQVDPQTGRKLKEELSFKDDGTMVQCVMPDNRKTGIPKWEMYEYYFSDSVIYKFDRKQVGKRKNGVYLVINERDEETKDWEILVYDITTLSTNQLVMEQIYPRGETKYYKNYNCDFLTGHKNKPQQAQLIQDDWYLIDTTTWTRNGQIYRFDKFSITIESQNLKSNLFEYYMSNKQEKEFNNTFKGKSLEGDYLVLKKLQENGESVAESYEILLLNEANLVLKQENKDNSILVLEREIVGLENNKSNYKDSVLIGSTLDFLSGTQWRASKENYNDYSLIPECIYYNASKRVMPTFKIVNGGYETNLVTWNCYIGTYADHNFNFKKLQEGNENGRFLNMGSIRKDGQKRSLPFEILYLSRDLFVIEQIPEIKIDKNGQAIIDNKPMELVKRFTFIRK